MTESGDLNVVQLRMSDDDYAKARSELGQRKHAAARWEQQLASLFVRSRWTQEQLAKVERRSQTWVCYHLRFGRFLEFITMVINAENPPNNLTERRFREYWDSTEAGNERQRFVEVQKLMAEDFYLRSANRPKVGHAIIEHFADGKWHAAEKIAARLETTVDHVEATLRTMIALGTYGVKVERKQVGASHHYRIFRKVKTITSAEVVEKLGPLIEQLRAEGKKSVDTMSPGTVARLAALLQKQLDAWAK